MATRAERSAERRSFWLHHFEQREASGLSVSAYTTEHSLSVPSWYAARKRYDGASRPAVSQPAPPTSATPSFARVVTSPVRPSASLICRVCLGNGVQVELDASLQALPAILAAVGTLQ